MALIGSENYRLRDNAGPEVPQTESEGGQMSRAQLRHLATQQRPYEKTRRGVLLSRFRSKEDPFHPALQPTATPPVITWLQAGMPNVSSSNRASCGAESSERFLISFLMRIRSTTRRMIDSIAALP